MSYKALGVQFENKYNIKDIETPRHEMLSAQFKKSFAYHAILDRLPVILTNIIDHLTRNKDEIVNVYGEYAREEIKQIIARIAKLKYELQTDKNFLDLEHNEPDMDLWNTLLDELPKSKKTFFRSCWMDAECYTYRKLHTFFTQSETMREYDYFNEQKQEITRKYTRTMSIIAKISKTYSKKVECFAQLLQLLTWSHLEELCIDENYVFEAEGSGNDEEDIDQKEKDLILSVLLEKMCCILDDATNDVWRCLQPVEQDKPVIVDIVLNNAGYQLFICLLLAQFLIDSGLSTTIRFHVKLLPWYVLDVMEKDVFWFLDFLKEHDSEELRECGTIWRMYFDQGLFQIAKPTYFWTTSYPYFKMNDINPVLFDYIREARLIIFNGDLNYRKLLGDYSWDDSEEFLTCLRGFLPCHICCVRGVRAKVICGMRKIDTDKLRMRDSDWMSSGKYGIIQFAAPTYCGCESDDESIFPEYPYTSDSHDNSETCDKKFAIMTQRLKLQKSESQEQNKTKARNSK